MEVVSYCKHMHSHWLRRPIKGFSVLQPTDEKIDNLPQPWGLMNKDSRESTKTTKEEPLTFKDIDFPREDNDIIPTTLETETEHRRRNRSTP